MPNESKRMRPRTTTRGRIVYERKVHEFTEKDLIRVFKRVIERDSDESYIGWLAELVITLLQIALGSLFQLYKETLPAVIAEFIIKILSGLIQLLEKIGIAGYKFIAQAIGKAFGLLIVKEEFKEGEDGNREGKGD